MLTKLIEFSLTNRFLVLSVTILIAVAGAISAINLPIDAVPDMTNVQVQVVTSAGALSPLEVEQYVTTPVEFAMNGIPRVQELRSISRLGISLVTIVFDEGTDLYWARQLVNQRLIVAREKIPSGMATPEIGPLSTALGEVVQFEVRSDRHSIADLRSILDWDIAPQLRSVSGVTDVNSHGGYYMSYEIRPDPQKMYMHEISILDIARAVESNNLTAGGGYYIAGDQQRFIRGQALLKSVEDIQGIVLRSGEDDTPLLIRDVATVGKGALLRQGVATRDGRGEVVIGMAMMLVGENSRLVVHRIKDKLKSVNTSLPEGVSVEIIYDRTDLIDRALVTVVENLVAGGALVIIILLLMLGNFRAGVVTALAIPLSMLFAANVMYVTAISASLMSLGAIDFGLIVDSSVIMVENCLRRLGIDGQTKTQTEIIRDAAIEVRKPTMFGELIIAIVYLPILMLEGSEGKLFRPMALTVLFALGASLVLSLTFIPAATSLILPRRAEHHEVWLIRGLKQIYEPMLRWIITRPYTVSVLGLLLFIVSLPVAYNLGGEFMPKLNEGDILIEANRLPSSTLEGAVPMSASIESIIKSHPEVKTVFCKTGRPEIANDVMGVQQTDIWVMLNPHDEWPSSSSKEKLIESLSRELSDSIPGALFAFTQPIEMRVDELVAGVKADVACLIYGDYMQELARLGKQVEHILRSIEGQADVKADYQANLSTLKIEVNRAASARFGIQADDIMAVVSSLGEFHAGTILDGRKRFPIVIRMPEEWRGNAERVGQLPVLSAAGQSIPLRELASIQVEETPPAVEHEWNRRRTFVQANVRGRDVASFVAEAQRRIKSEVQLPSGYEIRWGGDFENLQRASLRLSLITPIVLLLIGLLLHTTLKSASLAALIFLAVPIAASGGVYALAIRQMPFSISAGVGFIALFGVAVLNGLVWVSAAENRRQAGDSMREVLLNTGLSRLRPVLITALVAGLGFLPMAFSTSDGAEIQRPLATVVIGGLVTATLLTTLVLPAIYPWFAPKTVDMVPASAERTEP